MSLTTEDLKEIQGVVLEGLAPWMEHVELRFDDMDKRFDGNDQRFDGIDKRFDSMDQRFDGIDQRLDRIETVQHQHTSQLKELQWSVDSLGARIEKLEGRVLALERDVKEIYSMVEQPAKKKRNKLVRFKKKSVEGQILELYKTVLELAEEAKVTLPR